MCECINFPLSYFQCIFVTATSRQEHIHIRKFGVNHRFYCADLNLTGTTVITPCDPCFMQHTQPFGLARKNINTCNEPKMDEVLRMHEHK